MQRAGLSRVLLLCCAAVCASGMTREYFLKIEEVSWNYAPSGMNIIQNKSVLEDEEASVFLKRSPQRIGSTYKKAVYKQYSDATFRTEVMKAEWMGILGPLLMAEEGDTVTRRADRALYPDGTGPELKRDDAVAPGAGLTYHWTVTENHGPTAEDSNCLTTFYHSHVNAPKDINSGLIGPLIVCRRGTLDIHGDSTGDYLYALLFMVLDENFSWYLDDNVDMHSVHFHGQILTTQNHHTDTVSLFPASSSTAEMVADNPGHWLLTCTVNDHLMAGMQAIFEIRKCFPNVHRPVPHGQFEVVSATVNHYRGGMRANYTVEKCSMFQRQGEIMFHSKTYYVAAMEMDWDYSPNRTWENEMFRGQQSPGSVFLDKEGGLIGSIYKKVVYRQFTNNKFTKQMERAADMEHLGIMGPMILADVGDKVTVVFKNMASRPYSIHAHGVKTNNPEVHLTQPGL
ncbi:Hephaestin [Liparis tanakae]|uniref:Hephaestin n=1 Tax=Liparis tanakae TaxID=230148 RepID=A0A4Z2GP25_9TELE|nr:Hephaestin [Liparis tanakae]